MAPIRSSSWWRHGAWNTLEHAVTRASDSLATLLLVLILDPSKFARLALAQAIVAPLLFLSVTPESALYRHFAAWREEGPERLAARLRYFRRFAWGKGPAAILLSALLALAVRGGGWTDRFAALVWAFGLVLTPQVAGPDREFLRISLRLKSLNVVNLVQKLSLLGGTALAVLLRPGRLELLAAVPVLSALLTVFLARGAVEKVLAESRSISAGAVDPLTSGATRRSPQSATAAAPLQSDAGDARLAASTAEVPAAPAGGSALRPPSASSESTDLPSATPLRFWPFIFESLRSFSIWNHLLWIATNWVQTMDVFFLGIFRLAAVDLGLYSMALKLANLSSAAPLALSNLFSVWLGRRSEEGAERERRSLIRFTGWLALALLAQLVVLYLLGPYILRLFSRGRWSASDLARTLVWFRWMLVGYGIFGATGLLQAWFLLRSPVRDLCFRVYLSWTLASLGVYAVTAWLWRTSGTAPANVAVSLILVVLLLLRFRGSRRPTR